jgi:hypothetical protein
VRYRIFRHTLMHFLSVSVTKKFPNPVSFGIDCKSYGLSSKMDCDFEEVNMPLHYGF